MNLFPFAAITEPLLSGFSNHNSTMATDRAIPLLDAPAEDPHKKFVKNIIISSRYTIWNFFPKSLLEQFRRLANVYFLVLGIIASVGAYTSFYETAIEPAGILAPMIIVVLISVVKDGIEDVKRHHADMRINSHPAKIVNKETGEVTEVQWKDLTVGDVILILGDDEIPADTIVLACGGVQGATCFVETAAIDGETNLKLKNPCLVREEAGSGSGDRNNAESKNTDQQPNSLFMPITWSSDTMKVEGLSPYYKGTHITVEPPNGSIHRFNGVVEIVTKTNQRIEAGESLQLTLTEKNLLLRGSILRASEWCVGQIAYTGADTKLSLNSKQTPSKLSSVDRIVNRTLVIAITAMLFVCVLSMIFGIVWENIHDSANYLCLKKDDLATEYVNGVGCSNGSTSTYLTIFTFATLYNNFVCISMYVSLEMVYLCQSYFLSNDLKLYDPTTDSPAECHTSGMCADLGQVQYILSDKTGTLTKNLMIVKQFSIADQIFGEQQFDGNTSTYPAVIHSNDVSSSPLFEKKEMESTWTLPVTSDNKSPVGKLAHDFIRVLVLCNTAMLMPDQFGAVNISTTDELVESLQAESPDEVALILAGARHCGRLLTKRGNRFLESIELSSSTSKQSKAPERVEVLAVNEFESDRKMMSILLRIPDGGNTRIVLLCKGADSSMLKNCSESANPYTTICMDHIEKFAQTGLRTLVLAKKELSEAEAASWLQEYKRASNSLIDRDLMLSQCAHKIEKDMMLLGAVGIEDELQDGAPEAISMMRKAGLNVWMITGDKAATAAAIGKKCCLISEEKMEIVKIINLTDSILKEKVMELAEVVARKKREAVTSASNSLEDGNSKEENMELALIVDGISLESLWASDELKASFVESVQFVPTVIACRVSPLQKAALVRMIKTGPTHPITLSIGDGANDVSMIHESRVGVGICGKEGRHAANSADFAISQFSFLVTLLLEHGRFNYLRCSNLVLYSFFKNLMLVSLLFYYCTYSGWSGTIPLDSIVYSGYNFYLGLPILVLGAFDYDVPRESVLEFPYLAYSSGRLGEMLNLKNMARWCFLAFVQGVVLFALVVRFVGGANVVYSEEGEFAFDIAGNGLVDPSTGWTLGLFPGGFMMYSLAVLAMQYKVAMMTTTKNWIFWFVWFLSFAGFLFFVYLYGLFPSLDWYNVVPLTFSAPVFWLALLIIPVIMMLIDYVLEVLWTILFPSSADKLRFEVKALSAERIRFGNRLRSIFKLPAVTNARVEKMKSFEDGDGAVNMTERSFGSVNVKKENPTF